MRRLVLSAALVALLGAAATACSRGHREVTPRPIARAPGKLELEEAAGELTNRIRRLYPRGGWPPHLPRSQDFPALPLVVILAWEDENQSGADLTALQAELEEAIRREHLLRLEADELAVPPSLREGDSGWPGPTSQPAGLVLRVWIDPARRIRIALEDRTKPEPVVLVVARSRGL